MTIDWRRAAQPQADGYDVAIMQEYLRSGPYKDKAYTRARPEHGTHIWPNESDARLITLKDHNLPHPEYQEIAPDHPHVVKGFKQLELFANIMPLAKSIVAVAPFQTGHGFGGHGCSCGNYADDWGWIYCSADNAWGLAEGIVHEMNHWKLRAFGVWFEHWSDELIANDPTELYDSPVRKDKPRPMGAVLHAHYSYVAVAEMCGHMLAAEPAPTREDVSWTQTQFDRITAGRSTLAEHFRGTEAGKEFIAGVLEWTDRVLREGALLMEHGV